jgi:iron complex outermembrane receptor protein
VNQPTLRRRLLATTLFCVMAASSGAAWADAAADAGADGGDATVDEVVVTGSRIARSNLENPTPTLVLGTERLQQQGYSNLADILTSTPQFSAAFGASRTQSTFSGASSSGLNLTNLRNLGSQRSLVLVNGRRVPSGQISTSAVDLNTLPSANIDRVEVITGGASAVYGADAVSGVVNIITKKIDGVEFGLSYGEATAHHDNINPSGYLMVGHDLGAKGHAEATLQYDYQGLVSCADRYLCAQDFFWSPPGAPLRGPSAYSGVPLGGRYFIDGLPGSYTQRNGSFTDGGTLIPFSVTVDGYNRNAARTLAIPTERIMFQSEASYRFNDAFNVFLEVNYGSSKTHAPFEGHPFQSSNGGDQLGGVELSIPTTNPFVPTALFTAATSVGDTQITWWRRFNSAGFRGADNLRQMVRGVVGANGDLPTLFGLGRDWHWEASFTYGRTSLDDNQTGLVDKTHLYAALRVEPDPASPGNYRCTDPIARAQGCIPVNPFRATGFSAAENAYLVTSAGIRAAQTLEDFQAYASGQLFNLPAGPVKIATGVESRHVTAFRDYSDGINRGILTGNQIGDNPQATFHTDEAYVEAVVPVLSDMPFARSLNVEGAYRRSWPRGGESYDTFKYGGDWTPFPGLKFRIMQARAVRSPDLSETTGGGTTAGNINDPCTAARRNANATRAANCLADGVPNGYTPPIVVEQNVNGFVGSNPNVRPETADTLTYGVVFQAGAFEGAPAWLAPLTVTVDRFSIDLKDTIGQLGRQNITNLCYDTAGAARATYCSQLTRGSDPSVPGANYVLKTVNDTTLNVGRFQIKGVDLEAAYVLSLPRGAGRLSLSTYWTFYDKALETTPLVSINQLGFAGGSTSDQGWLKRQGRINVGWALGPVNVYWTTRYVGETHQTSSEPAGTPTIPATFYHDVQIKYQVTPWAQAYFGINNLMDKDPPFFISGASGTQALDTIPAYYDVMGRQLYGGIRMKF